MSKKKQNQKARGRNKKLQTHLHKPSPEELLPLMNAVHPPRLDEYHPPEGFHAVPYMQAMMAVAEPLQKLANDDGGDEGMEDANNMMSVLMNIWNSTLPKMPEHQKKTREELVEQICDAYQMDETDAEALLDEILERKAYLVPDDIQPEDPRTMFIRKEREYQIAPINDAQVAFQDNRLAISPEDVEMLRQLRRLDGMLADGEEFDRWESLYFEVERACGGRYFEWLKANGVQEEYYNAFPFCIEFFLDFVYRYNAGTPEILQYHELEDFLLYHLVRKMMVRPEDYALWLPAIRFFYRFLGEKQYLSDPQRVIGFVNSIEPEFLAYLKEIF